ncbi:ABC transporter permease, partial [Tianweitania sp.]|uniref:ABC transporter permease n=1 Tax=Tianweitania sp. TaxID=2021634 RepID=UPI0028A269D3
LPSLVAIIATVGCLLVTSLSLAREREEGTFDQLLVTPLTPAYIMLGKAVPGILVAMAQGGIISLAAVWLYGVPFTGTVWLLMLATFAYALALSGVGLLLSAISNSQQQAFLGVFCFMVPSVVLSGYLAPVENMPTVLRWISAINPLTHFIEMAKGIFLKSYGLAETQTSLLALLAIAVVTLLVAHWVFWKQTKS